MSFPKFFWNIAEIVRFWQFVIQDGLVVANFFREKPANVQFCP